jgi:hypothetical protein
MSVITIGVRLKEKRMRSWVCHARIRAILSRRSIAAHSHFARCLGDLNSLCCVHLFTGAFHGEYRRYIEERVRVTQERISFPKKQFFIQLQLMHSNQIASSHLSFRALEDIGMDASKLKLMLYYHRAQPEYSLPANVDAFREDANIHLASILTHERSAIEVMKQFNDQAETLIKGVSEKLRNRLPPEWDGKGAEPFNYTEGLSLAVPSLLHWKLTHLETQLIPGIAERNNRLYFSWVTGSYLVCDKDQEQEYRKAIKDTIEGESTLEILRQLKKLEEDARTNLQAFTSGVTRMIGDVSSGIPLLGECDSYKRQKATST